MRICVYGLWHLGSVTAACLAQHFDTIGSDPNAATVASLQRGNPPVLEPGLSELIAAGLAGGRLSFSADLPAAIQGADLIWVTFDTPVTEEDVADVDYVRRHVEALFPHLHDGAVLLISAQVPVGFTAGIESEFRSRHPERRVAFAYSPENLRLGKALDSFRRPERVVVGIRDKHDRARLSQLIEPFCKNIEWMSVESAEMTKHALNAFLATSIAFINEVAALCEHVGADAKEVERGLKSEPRIGPKAYLSPGVPFAGGTLARDLRFLSQLGGRMNIPTRLLSAVYSSNDEHKNWPQRKLTEMLGDLSGRKIAILGLTYKPGTDTLRRSSAVELCKWARTHGAELQAYDPAIRQLPDDLRPIIRLCESVAGALDNADALVVATEWPEFRALSADEILRSMRIPNVVDANRFLDPTLSADPRIRYAAVGQSRSRA